MKRVGSLLLCLLLVPSATPAHGIDWQPLPETAPAPADNPMAPEKIELGKALFFDSRFSSNGTVSCFSCHNVMEGGDDDRPISPRVHGQPGGRNAPTVWNAAFQGVQFWDARAGSLEAQLAGPLVNPPEKGMPTLDATIWRIRDIPGYKPLFAAAFPGKDPVTMENAAKAIASYERTLLTPHSAYDRYAKGDAKAMTDEQIRGMETFGAVGCAGCHAGPAFNGPGRLAKFPVHTKSKFVAKYQLAKDRGRYELTKQPSDDHLWRVPTLRNLLYTAPYFHNGSVKTLEEAVRVMAKTELDKNLVDADVSAIVAFLEALSGDFPPQTMPRLPATPDKLLP